MSESSTESASSPGAQAAGRLYTADEVRELLTDVFTAGANAPKHFDSDQRAAYRATVVAMSLDRTIGADVDGD